MLKSKNISKCQFHCPKIFIPFVTGNPRVDYLSLDIEGAELAVLQTIPWSQVDIKVVGIEVNHVGKVFDGR